MKIVTTLSPKRQSLQIFAIKSWINLGLEVISFNTNEDLTKLAPWFKKNIDFISPKYPLRNNKYINALDPIKYCLAQTQPTIIINSDIILRCSKADIEDMSYFAEFYLLIGNRQNIKSIQDKHWQTYHHGFDYFVMYNKFDHLFNTNIEMYMGEPVWDYWVPIECIRKGITPMIYTKPIAFHIEHDVLWDGNSFALHVKSLAKSLGCNLYSIPEVDKFVQKCYETIDTRSLKWPPT